MESRALQRLSAQSRAACAPNRSTAARTRRDTREYELKIFSWSQPCSRRRRPCAGSFPAAAVWRAAAALALLAVLRPVAVRGQDDAPEPQNAGGDERPAFSVLSYNVHGLFALIAHDNPRDRSPTIGWLANNYDVALFQEDFEYHDILRQQMAGKTAVRGNGIGCDPRRVAAKVLLFPFELFLPHFSPPYGAGISAMVRSDLMIPDAVRREAYGTCYGWFGANGDCWANKGYLRVRVGQPGGWQADVYTTHLEAGPSQESVETRRHQLWALARAIAEESDHRAVIVAGDFNISFARPGDRESITEFRRTTGLLDTGAGPEIAFWRERDFILYRNGTDTELGLGAAGEATEFVNQNRALSDHPALYARFHVNRHGLRQP